MILLFPVLIGLPIFLYPVTRSHICIDRCVYIYSYIVDEKSKKSKKKKLKDDIEFILLV